MGRAPHRAAAKISGIETCISPVNNKMSSISDFNFDLLLSSKKGWFQHGIVRTILIFLFNAN